MKVPKPSISTMVDQWAGEDVFVVGTGWSLQGFNWDVLSGERTICLNNAVFVVQHPDIHLYADTAIAKRYKDHRYHNETKIVCQPGAVDVQRRSGNVLRNHNVMFKNQGKADGIKKNDHLLFCSRTVATAGVMLAWKLGASRIFLLGVDACRPRGSDQYYYDGSTKKLEQTKRKKRQDKIDSEVMTSNGVIVERRHKKWGENMVELKKFFDRECPDRYAGPWPEPGVYNLSVISSLSAWEKVPAATVFEEDPWLK